MKGLEREKLNAVQLKIDLLHPRKKVQGVQVSLELGSKRKTWTSFRQLWMCDHFSFGSKMDNGLPSMNSLRAQNLFFLRIFLGAKKKVVLREFAVGLFRRWSPTCIWSSICLFLPSSHSVPKALSALAASDTDEEDQESTPVITNGNGESAAVASAKPTAPLPSENDGKLYLLKSKKQRPKNKSHQDPKVSSYCSWYSMNIPAGHGTLFLGQLSINHLKSRCSKNRIT